MWNVSSALSRVIPKKLSARYDRPVLNMYAACKFSSSTCTCSIIISPLLFPHVNLKFFKRYVMIPKRYEINVRKYVVVFLFLRCKIHVLFNFEHFLTTPWYPRTKNPVMLNFVTGYFGIRFIRFFEWFHLTTLSFGDTLAPACASVFAQLHTLTTGYLHPYHYFLSKQNHQFLHHRQLVNNQLRYRSLFHPPWLTCLRWCLHLKSPWLTKT